jgi:hypothetical protein
LLTGGPADLVVARTPARQTEDVAR